jgi:hypothetical protein
MYPLAEQAENKDYKKFLSLTEKYEKDPAKAKQIAYERFLNQRALINAFNRKAIMDLSNGTYTDMVLDMVDEFKHLKVKYPILAQLSKPNLKSGQSVLTLNDLKDLKDPQLAEIYYQNIKDLADETVHKVSDMQDNARISKLFSLFPVMMIYQHGLGYSKYGFNDVLPYEDYIGVMQTASDIFMNNEMSNSTLETVYDRLVNSRGLFPDYVTAPGLYRSGMPRQADEIITTDVNDERVQEMLSRVIGSDTEETPTQPSTQPAEFKVGDKVKDKVSGQLGTITKLDVAYDVENPDLQFVYVKFENGDEFEIDTRDLDIQPEAPEMKRDTPIQPEVSDMIQPEGLPAIPRTSSSCK